tara:strand:- start:941 stop:1165 length:225 start_codon:yes stop_codon:yes gene_type:complete
MYNPCWANVFLNLRFGGLNFIEAGPNNFIAPLKKGAIKIPPRCRTERDISVIEVMQTYGDPWAYTVVLIDQGQT